MQAHPFRLSGERENRHGTNAARSAHDRRGVARVLRAFAPKMQLPWVPADGIVFMKWPLRRCIPRALRRLQ